MCRLTVYKGKPILIGDIVIRPQNSLLFQSRSAAYHPGVVDETHRRNILVNGDGFGVAWYGQNRQKGSCCFKFVTPAWSNENLRNIGEHVPSHLIFAHIRAASSGHNPHEKIAVSHENCHPFKFQNFTFMHNGAIPQFSRLKFNLIKLLSEKSFQEIKGSTDSEHIFALFLEFLPKDRPNTTVKDMIHSLNLTISTIIHLCEISHITDPCSFNICVTDEVNIIATRYRNGPDQPPSLYYSFGSDFVCDAKGNFYPTGKSPDEIVISSAPLSKVDCKKNCAYYASGEEILGANESGCWALMPKNHMLVAYGDKSDMTKIKSIKLFPVHEANDFAKLYVDSRLTRAGSPVRIKYELVSESENSTASPHCNRYASRGNKHQSHDSQLVEKLPVARTYSEDYSVEECSSTSSTEPLHHATYPAPTSSSSTSTLLALTSPLVRTDAMSTTTVCVKAVLMNEDGPRDSLLVEGNVQHNAAESYDVSSIAMHPYSFNRSMRDTKKRRSIKSIRKIKCLRKDLATATATGSFSEGIASPSKVKIMLFRGSSQMNG